MEFREFGPAEGKAILLLHGNLMCWRQFEEIIPYLEQDYRVIAVSMDGFDGTGESSYPGFRAEAEKLADYALERCGGHLHCVFGESLGCGPAGYLFEDPRVRVDAMVLSGPQKISLGPLNFLWKAVAKNQYRLLGKIRDPRWKMPLMMKLYTRRGEEVRASWERNIPENISLESLQKTASEAVQMYRQMKKFPARPYARVAVWYGEREPNIRSALRSLKRVYPNLQEVPLGGYGHGEIMEHPEQCAMLLRRYLKSVEKEQADG